MNPTNDRYQLGVAAGSRQHGSRPVTSGHVVEKRTGPAQAIKHHLGMEMVLTDALESGHSCTVFQTVGH